MYLRRSTCMIIKRILTVIMVVPVIWTGAWLSHQTSTKCETYLNKPFLIIGILLLLLSLARLLLLLISGGNNESPDSCISCGMVVLFFVLLGYTVFALIATTTPATQGSGEIEYSKYSKSLRNLVVDNYSWRHIKDCFIFETKVCSTFHDVIQNETYPRLQSSDFDSVKYGCCTPLKACNFTYDDSHQVWTKAEDATLVSKQHCSEWSDDPYVLCFKCQSCKNGFLHDIKTSWKKAATVNIAVILSLVILWYCCDCGLDPEEVDDYSHDSYNHIS